MTDRPNAIGYTVYYYANDMKMAQGLKILSIDGVMPNDETIASKKYPFLNPYFAVIATKTPKDSPARVMYSWLQSPEGQHLVKTEGYVPRSRLGVSMNFSPMKIRLRRITALGILLPAPAC